MKFATTAALVLGAILLGSGLYQLSSKPTVSGVPSEVVEAFKKWKLAHKRTYATPKEELYRLGLFFKSFARIAEKRKTVTYQVGLNLFSDMTIEEVKAKYFGFKRQVAPEFENYEDFSGVEAPTEVDWTTKGAVTHIKNQGQCGSCWAFSTTGSLEGAHFLKTGSLQSFSEQYLVDCATNGNYGCNGGEMTNALTYVEENGIPLESAYPYKGRDGTCKQVQSTYWKISSWKKVKRHSATSLMSAIAQQPISIGIEADEILDYTGGIFSNSRCRTSIDHGVLAVGYGTNDHQQDYWKVKNSWGTSWGEQGYIRFERNMQKSTNVCGILIEGEYPIA